ERFPIRTIELRARRKPGFAAKSACAHEAAGVAVDIVPRQTTVTRSSVPGRPVDDETGTSTQARAPGSRRTRLRFHSQRSRPAMSPELQSPGGDEVPKSADT